MENNKEAIIKERVEAMGVFFEKAGYSPMMGRVFALLLLSEPPYQDFYQIQEFLSASKSAVSNALNTLMKGGSVDYITFSGDRKRYFRVNLARWLNDSRERVKQIDAINLLLKGVLDERADSKHLAFNEGLQKMIDFHSHLASGMQRIMKEWDEIHNQA